VWLMAICRAAHVVVKCLTRQGELNKIAT
jgi:hypothetical protein